METGKKELEKEFLEVYKKCSKCFEEEIVVIEDALARLYEKYSHLELVRSLDMIWDDEEKAVEDSKSLSLTQIDFYERLCVISRVVDRLSEKINPLSKEI